MKKLILICVNYNSYEALRDFLESVNLAAAQAADVMRVDVAIADNSTTLQAIDTAYAHINSIITEAKGNLGYLGGALPLYNAYAQAYDYVSISNVDLQLAKDFFIRMLEIQDDSIGWIAPDIYTGKIDRHENPSMLKCPTTRNFAIWNIIYSCTFIYRIYHFLYLLKSKKRANVHASTIYAGHGSFMLFTSRFIAHYPELHFPTFMYGEEIFFAELTHAARLKVWYAPELQINNIGNISTGQLSLKQRANWSKESLLALQKQFFTTNE